MGHAQGRTGEPPRNGYLQEENLGARGPLMPTGPRGAGKNYTERFRWPVVRRAITRSVFAAS